jgi:hypothetical protein
MRLYLGEVVNQYAPTLIYPDECQDRHAEGIRSRDCPERLLRTSRQVAAKGTKKHRTSGIIRRSIESTVCRANGRRPHHRVRSAERQTIFDCEAGMWPPPIPLRTEAGLPLGRPLLLPDIPLAAALDKSQGAQSCYDKRQGVRLREEKVKATRAKLRVARQHVAGLA